MLTDAQRGRQISARYRTERPTLLAARPARGVDFGYLDYDGFIDLAINCNNQPAVILHNEGGRGNHWLSINQHGGSGQQPRRHRRAGSTGGRFGRAAVGHGVDRLELSFSERQARAFWSKKRPTGAAG
jgi:hypothetical protein